MPASRQTQDWQAGSIMHSLPPLALCYPINRASQSLVSHAGHDHQSPHTAHELHCSLPTLQHMPSSHLSQICLFSALQHSPLRPAHARPHSRDRVIKYGCATPARCLAHHIVLGTKAQRSLAQQPHDPSHACSYAGHAQPCCHESSYQQTASDCCQTAAYICF
jgi:hypothetical protein